MKKGFLVSLLAIVPAFILSGCESLVVFDPQGPVARNIMHLINWSIVLMAIVCLVVFALFGTIVWKYRASRKNAKYDPEEHGSTKLEIVWTVIPLSLIHI